MRCAAYGVHAGRALHAEVELPGQESMSTLRHALPHHEARLRDLGEHVLEDADNGRVAAHFVERVLEIRVRRIHLAYLAHRLRCQRFVEAHQALQCVQLLFVVHSPVTLRTIQK
jgi:hypothetical protein